MEFQKLQKLSAEIVKRIDEKLGVKRGGEFTISQLVEELGELARVVNSERMGRRVEKRNLAEEFADVLIQLAALADLYQLDLERAVLEKIEILKERHGLS